MYSKFLSSSRHRLYAWVDLDNEERQSAMKAQITQEFDQWPNALTTNIYQVNEKGEISVVNPQPECPKEPEGESE